MTVSDEDNKKALEGDEKQLKWYFLQVQAGQEKSVKKTLQDRIDLQPEALREMFSDILVPTEDVVEMRAGQKRKTERKFFPGYILIRMHVNEDTWYLIKSVSKVKGFVGGTPEKPASVSDEEVKSILGMVEEGESKPKPKILFEPGEVVRVNDGPFTDFNGVVEDVNYEKSRLRVSVSIFGRSTPVDLEFSQVEKC